MNIDKIWGFSVSSMNVIGNIILLQIINIVLILLGHFEITIPLIVIINSLMIYEYIFTSDYTFLLIIKLVKENILNILAYIIITMFLLYALSVNESMQTYIISNNASYFFSEILLMVFSVFIIFALTTFFIFFPLVNNTTKQKLAIKLKVTFSIPFYSIKLFLLVILSTFINSLFFFSNAFFFIIFGPVLLLAANIILFNKYMQEKGEK